MSYKTNKTTNFINPIKDIDLEFYNRIILA